MELTILISLAVLIVWLTFRKYVNAKRVVYYNQLDGIYDRMELFIAKSGMKLDDLHIKYLKAYKNLIVNPELADIRIMLMLEVLTPNKSFDKQKAEFKAVRESLPEELNSLTEKFDSTVRSLINLSMLKPAFAYSIIRLIIITIFKHGISSIPKFYNRFTELLKNELIIAPRVANDKLGLCA
jgi:hypothetical protein